MDMPSIFTASRLNRRSFLKTAGAVAGAATLGTDLAACGSSGNTVTIQFWDYFVSQAPWVDNEIQLFQAAHPKIKIKISPLESTTTTITIAKLFSCSKKSRTIRK